jgi:hypothetical protein
LHSYSSFQKEKEKVEDLVENNNINTTNTMRISTVITLCLTTTVVFLHAETVRCFVVGLAPIARALVTTNNNNNNKLNTATATLSMSKSGGETAAAANITPPPLRRHPPRKICLMVEPTPFTHVSGYANRFKEMLKFLKKAGDDVDILTVDSKTAADQLPVSHQGYPVRHTQGFTFPLYNHISLTFDLPEMKGAQMIENHQPDLIHVTSPGFLLFAALFYARVMCIPVVMSYHTHLPTYGTYVCGVVLLLLLLRDCCSCSHTHKLSVALLFWLFLADAVCMCVCLYIYQARIIWDSFQASNKPVGSYYGGHIPERI